MSIVLTLLALLATFTILLALYIAVRIPAVVPISRSRVLKASPEKIFPYLSEARRVQQWNPFLAGDPTVTMSFAGPAEGVGAQASWVGKSGVGKSTVTEVEPGKRVAMRLEFQKPFRATNHGEYSLQPTEGGTQVTWLVNETAFVPRALSVLLDLDKLVGNQFEKGLAKLETLVTAG